MSDKAWKVSERRAAALIGGRRVYFAGAAGDAESAWAVADAKRDKRYTLNRARKDLAKLKVGAGARLPIVVHFDQPGSGRRVDAVVIVRAQDFEDWFGSLSGSADET